MRINTEDNDVLLINYGINERLRKVEFIKIVEKFYVDRIGLLYAENRTEFLHGKDIRRLPAEDRQDSIPIQYVKDMASKSKVFKFPRENFNDMFLYTMMFFICDKRITIDAPESFTINSMFFNHISNLVMEF